jgi:hypothetical protein
MDEESKRKMASSGRQALEMRAKKMLDKYKKSPEQENEEGGLYSKASAASQVKHNIADSGHLTAVTKRIHNTKDGHGIISRDRREAFAKSLENAYDEKKYKEGQGKKK